MFYLSNFLARAHEPQVSLPVWALAFVIGAMARLAFAWGEPPMIVAGIVFALLALCHGALQIARFAQSRDK